MPSSTSNMIEEHKKRYFTKMNVLWLVSTVLVFSALVKLGLWQSARALEKEQRLAQIEKLSSQKPISLTQVLALVTNGKSDTDINDYPVLIEGEFNEAEVFLLDNQVNNGRLGYRVFQVALTNEHAVLISLGWVQGSINRQVLPKVTALNGQYRFKGHIRLVDVGILLKEQHFSAVNWPLRVQQIELDKFSLLINRELLPFVVYLDKNEVIGFEKNWQPIVMPPEKHRAYAFQWFSLALAWMLLMIWAKFSGSKKNNKDKSKAK